MSDIAYKRRLGDRKDGRRIRSLPAFNSLIPFIMKTRNDACNQFSDSVEFTEPDRWLREKRAEGYKGLGALHLFVAAYVRAISIMPGLNRFTAGQRVYARNKIEISMAVKRSLTINASETTVKVEMDPKDTVFDVYRKMNVKIDEIKASENANNTEQLAGLFQKLPRLLLRFAVGFISFLDYFGFVPRAVLTGSPFHASMFITDMGSLGIPPIYHHLYNFGHLPVFIAFGAKRRVIELDKTGQPVEHRYIDFKVVTDERVADGHYYATGFKYFKYYLRNPHLLEQPPEAVVEDIP